MTIWERLGIERTEDKRKIKHAYAKQAAQHHPEEQPEEFQKLYQAYQQALSYAADPSSDVFALRERKDTAYSPQPPEQGEEAGIDFSALNKGAKVPGIENLVNTGSSSKAPEQNAGESAVDFSALNKGAKVPGLENPVNTGSSSKAPEQNAGESTVDFSAFERDVDVPVEERLIEGILHDMQAIIEEGTVKKGITIFLEPAAARQLREWKKLLATPAFQRVRNNREFIVKLNELECIPRLSGDMAVCLYSELEFTRFEKKDYEELKVKLQRSINRVLWKRKEAERREKRVRFIRHMIIPVIVLVCFVGSFLAEVVASRLEERKLAAVQALLEEKYHRKFEVVKTSVGGNGECKYLCEPSEHFKYEWFSGTLPEGDGTGGRCTIIWNKEDGLKDNFAYELIERYRQECNAADSFDCGEGWLQDESYQYEAGGMIHNYPIYDVRHSYKKKCVYSIEEIQQLKDWIHKIQLQDAFFVHAPYIKLLFRGLHGEEYELKLTQDDTETDYHTLIRELEQLCWRGKGKQRKKSK